MLAKFVERNFRSIFLTSENANFNDSFNPLSYKWLEPLYRRKQIWCTLWFLGFLHKTFCINKMTFQDTNVVRIKIYFLTKQFLITWSDRINIYLVYQQYFFSNIIVLCCYKKKACLANSLKITGNFNDFFGNRYIVTNDAAKLMKWRGELFF